MPLARRVANPKAPSPDRLYAPVESAGQTITFAELAPWQQDNPAILTGYRRGTRSWTRCIDSLWWWHNESVNIWSHLLGALVSFVTIFAFSLVIPSTYYNFSQGKLERAGIWAPFTLVYPFSTPFNPMVKWEDAAGFILFFVGCLVCFACSATFHTSLCHSQDVVRYMNRIDYLGILVLGTVNFFPTFHYAFFCDPALRNLYILLMSLSGCTGIYLVCSPTYATPAYRRMRTYTFFVLGFVALIPFAHALLRYGLYEASNSLSLGWISVEVLAYIGGALLYSERYPERLAPGKFDFLGSSHQIFHCCSLLAVLAHYAAIGEGFRYWYGEREGICH